MSYEAFTEKMALDLCTRIGVADKPDTVERVLKFIQGRYTKDIWQGAPSDPVYEEVMQGLASKLKPMMAALNAINNPESKSVIKSIADYSKMQDYVFVRVKCYRAEKEKLDNHGVFTMVGDIALTLYVYMTDSKFTGGRTLSSSLVTPQFIELWGVDREALWARAWENTVAMNPARLVPFEEIINFKFDSSNLKYDFMSTLGDYKFKKSLMNIYALTDATQTNGATALFYPGVCARVAELLGEDFYCIPHSIEDVVIHPVSTVKDSFVRRTAVQETKNPLNRGALQLSRRAFRYSAAEDRLIVLPPYHK